MSFSYKQKRKRNKFLTDKAKRRSRRRRERDPDKIHAPDVIDIGGILSARISIQNKKPRKSLIKKAAINNYDLFLV